MICQHLVNVSSDGGRLTAVEDMVVVDSPRSWTRQHSLPSSRGHGGHVGFLEVVGAQVNLPALVGRVGVRYA
jgi:hypothetical protein